MYGYRHATTLVDAHYYATVVNSLRWSIVYGGQWSTVVNGLRWSMPLIYHQST
jgi:hypothetical protein